MPHAHSTRAATTRSDARRPIRRLRPRAKHDPRLAATRLLTPDSTENPETRDPVDKGVVDAGFAWTHYWSGKNTAAALFSNPAAGRPDS